MNPDENKSLEKDELTGDEILNHEYDGIKELNNALPKWWLWLFYITIIFSAYYLLRDFVLKTGTLQDEEYKQEMAAAEKKYKQSAATLEIDENTVTLLTDAASMEAGKETYVKLCMVCHLAEGQGIVGPNLTDEYWIHGCSINDVFRIIKVGNPSKGMVSWKDQLSPLQMQQVASYILNTFPGTNPPNPKEAQGEKCE